MNNKVRQNIPSELSQPKGEMLCSSKEREHHLPRGLGVGEGFIEAVSVQHGLEFGGHLTE